MMGSAIYWSLPKKQTVFDASAKAKFAPKWTETITA